MRQSWSKGLDEQGQIDIKQAYKESPLLRKRLKELLEDKKDVSYKSSISKDNYSSPNWAYLQADCRGYERALNEVIDLITSK